jgi:hypothetical protein
MTNDVWDDSIEIPDAAPLRHAAIGVVTHLASRLADQPTGGQVRATGGSTPRSRTTSRSRSAS